MSEVRKVKQFFERSAETFDSLYSENKTNPFMKHINRRFRYDIYERFALSINHVIRYKLKSALDIGCGPGRYAYALAQVGLKRIVGIDFSQRMIDLAISNRRTIQASDKICEFICCDFMEYELKEKFDVVLAMGFFDYIKDPASVLKKMKILANHSVVASFPSISTYRTPLRKIKYYFKPCPLYFYTRNRIQLLCSEVGFAKVEIIKIKGSGMDYFVTFLK